LDFTLLDTAHIDEKFLLSAFKEKVVENVNVKLVLSVLWDEIVKRKIGPDAA